MTRAMRPRARPGSARSAKSACRETLTSAGPAVGFAAPRMPTNSPAPTSPQLPRTAASPADPSPDAIEPETACPRCGAAPLAADGLCRACGTATAPILTRRRCRRRSRRAGRRGACLREQRQAADALAERAWKAAMFGCAFVPLNFYSIALLIILAERHERISPRWPAPHRLCLGAQPGRARRIRRGAVQFDPRCAATLSRERLRR